MGRRGWAPDALWLIGDQIYADAQAMEPLSPIERFLNRHQGSFSTPALQRLLAKLPSVCWPGEHELTRGYPLGTPLFKARHDRQRYANLREAADRQIATQAVHGYQMMHLPATARSEGWFVQRRGNVRIFFLDTVLHRTRHGQRPLRVVRERAMKALQGWLQEDSEGSDLHCLVTGSGLLPGLIPGADPANSGPPQSMQVSESERAEILGLLVERVPGRFVLLSAGYHLSWMGRVCRDGEPVGVAISAPALYAPMQPGNFGPQDLWLEEQMVSRSGNLSVLARDRAPLRGSGYCLLRFAPSSKGWDVEMRSRLIAFELGEAWSEHVWSESLTSRGRPEGAPMAVARGLSGQAPMPIEDLK